MDTMPAMEPSLTTPARWNLHRTADYGLALRLEPSGIEEGAGGKVAVLRMSEEEGWMLVHGADRVLSSAAAEASGTFTPGPTSTQARQLLAVYRYMVTSPDSEAHTRLVQATPWANWVEEVAAPLGIAWRVDVFAADDAQFLQAALAVRGVRVWRLENLEELEEAAGAASGE